MGANGFARGTRHLSEIASVDARLFRIPLAEVLVDAKHGDHTHFELITATVHLTDGRHGTGYTYTGGKGGHAILAMIEHDLAPFLIGKNADRQHTVIEWAALWVSWCNGHSV